MWLKLGNETILTFLNLKIKETFFFRNGWFSLKLTKSPPEFKTDCFCFFGGLRCLRVARGVGLSGALGRSSIESDFFCQKKGETNCFISSCFSHALVTSTSIYGNSILSHLHVNCQLGFQLWDICNWYYTTAIVIAISIYKIQKAFIFFIFFSFYLHSATGMKNEISQFHFPNIAIQHYKYSKL